MRWLDTRAVPVGRRRLSGADRLVTLLTPDHGRIAAVARGACLPRGRLGSALEPFGVTRVILSPARGEGLYRAEGADPERRFDRLSTDLTRCQAAGLVCAWARALAREEPSPQRFDLLVDALAALDAPESPVAAVVGAFLWRQAAHAGVAPRLDACVACGAACVVCHADAPPAALRLEPGGRVCARCRTDADAPLDAELWAGLTAMTAGERPLAVDVPEAAARRLVALAQGYLRAHFGRDLPR
jgi:DNA repair protein RecO (recombination protein O)